MTYSCILMDPPWHEPGGNDRGADDQYDTIREPSEILRTIVTAPCWAPAANSHLWLWTTVTSLEAGLWLVGALGYRYVTNAVWVKLARQQGFLNELRYLLGLGQYLRIGHEHLLFGVRGNGFAVRSDARDVPSVIAAEAPRDDKGQRIHSRKPEASYQLIERRTTGRRLEMFARVARPGWDAWGNQAPPADATTTTAAEGAAAP